MKFAMQLGNSPGNLLSNFGRTSALFRLGALAIEGGR